MDLVGRKLALADGGVVEGFFDLIAADLDAAEGQPVAGKVREALGLLRGTTASLRGAAIDAAGAAAVDYLRLFALVSMGWMWTRMAVAAQGDSALHQGKRALADFFAQRMLPQAQGLAASIAAGEASIMALDADAF